MIKRKHDFMAWALEQAALIERCGLEHIDASGIAEELRGLAWECENDLFNSLTQEAFLVLKGKSIGNKPAVLRHLRESPSLSLKVPKLIAKAVNHAIDVIEEIEEKPTLSAQDARMVLISLIQ